MTNLIFFTKRKYYYIYYHLSKFISIIHLGLITLTYHQNHDKSLTFINNKITIEFQSYIYISLFI